MAYTGLDRLCSDVYSFFKSICVSVDESRLYDVFYEAVTRSWYDGINYIEYCVLVEGDEEICITYHVIIYSLAKGDLYYRPAYLRLIVSRDKPLDEVMVFSPYIVEIESLEDGRVGVVLEYTSLKYVYRVYGKRECRDYRYRLHSIPHGDLWVE